MNNSDKILLDLCGGSGAWSAPYKAAGYDVRVITLPEWNVINVQRFPEFLRFIRPSTQEFITIESKNIYGILSAPPCTMFSRARTTENKQRHLEDGMRVVRACMYTIWHVQEKITDKRGLPLLKFWALENPMGSLRRFLGRPEFTFNPCDYGDPWTKQTDIWGWFKAPKKNPIQLSPSQQQLCKENNRKLPLISDFTSSKNTVRRAITPPGFAQAFFRANQ